MVVRVVAVAVAVAWRLLSEKVRESRRNLKLFRSVSEKRIPEGEIVRDGIPDCNLQSKARGFKDAPVDDLLTATLKRFVHLLEILDLFIWLRTTPRSLDRSSYFANCDKKSFESTRPDKNNNIVNA
ncbi:hypothetical protein TorRG33x02_323450 [Trema orientale]|uniref:Uncharacterized protein n=1 Tax=Trema orientale TaxID=63057 RepID=A0A2P5BF60_TREOI|nr:hypothetical protein TorRG33x02_323450 [Trema orientale]